MEVLAKDIKKAVDNWKKRHPEKDKINIRVGVEFENCQNCKEWRFPNECEKIGCHAELNGWCSFYECR